MQLFILFALPGTELAFPPAHSASSQPIKNVPIVLGPVPIPLSPMKHPPTIQAELIPEASMTAKHFALLSITTFIRTVNSTLIEDVPFL